MNSPCDYVNRFNDNQPKPLTKEIFLSFLNGSDVKMNCEIVRQHNPNAESYKKALPGVAWQSHFDGKLRTNANARPSGLFCLDVDIHHEPEFRDIEVSNGREAAILWAEQEAKERAKRWARMQQEDDSDITALGLGIVGIHISPSGTGVHVIAYCHHTCKTIPENQARLAKLLGTSYDEVCKDWARIYFLTPREDWTYLDLDNIFEDEEN
jgi:hypothetical protein